MKFRSFSEFRLNMRNSVVGLQRLRDRKLELVRHSVVYVSYSVFKVSDVMREIQS